MQIHAERNTIIKRWRLHGQLLKFHAQGDHQTVPLMAVERKFMYLMYLCMYVGTFGVVHKCRISQFVPELRKGEFDHASHLC